MGRFGSAPIVLLILGVLDVIALATGLACIGDKPGTGLKETVILPLPLSSGRLTPHPFSRPRASMPGWEPKVIMPAITHCDLMPALMRSTERCRSKAADHFAPIRLLHPCPPSLPVQNVQLGSKRYDATNTTL